MLAKRKASSETSSTATIGFEAKLWLTADKLRNNMDAAGTPRLDRAQLPSGPDRGEGWQFR